MAPSCYNVVRSAAIAFAPPRRAMDTPPDTPPHKEPFNDWYYVTHSECQPETTTDGVDPSCPSGILFINMASPHSGATINGPGPGTSLITTGVAGMTITNTGPSMVQSSSPMSQSPSVSEVDCPPLSFGTSYTTLPRMATATTHEAKYTACQRCRRYDKLVVQRALQGSVIALDGSAVSDEGLDVSLVEHDASLIMNRFTDGNGDNPLATRLLGLTMMDVVELSFVQEAPVQVGGAEVDVELRQRDFRVRGDRTGDDKDDEEDDEEEDEDADTDKRLMASDGSLLVSGTWSGYGDFDPIWLMDMEVSDEIQPQNSAGGESWDDKS